MNKYRLITVIIALLAALSGCTGSQESGDWAEMSPTVKEASIKDDEAPTKQNLHFSVVEAESPGYTLVPQEELDEKTNTYIAYANLAEVNITWDGVTISLAEAIRDGKLTVPEIFALARMDAQNGFCKESYVSKLGLTHFIYTYPECELWIAYDVYETPDGKRTLIDEIYIHSVAGSKRNIDFTYVDKDSEWGYFVDREDWGLTFEVSSVSPTTITVDYTQRKGQEIGELLLEEYMLFSRKDDGTSEYLARSERDTDGFPFSVQSDESGQITMDWSNTAGALDPGEYYLKITVTDSYNESDIHPLMSNYYDKQSYHIAFTIDNA